MYWSRGRLLLLAFTCFTCFTYLKKKEKGSVAQHKVVLIFFFDMGFGGDTIVRAVGHDFWLRGRERGREGGTCKVLLLFVEGEYTYIHACDSRID